MPQAVGTYLGLSLCSLLRLRLALCLGLDTYLGSSIDLAGIRERSKDLRTEEIEHFIGIREP